MTLTFTTMTFPPLLGFIGMPGLPEMVIVGLIAVLLFGSRLPGVMRNLGRGFVEFKKGVRGVEDEIDSASSSYSSYDDTDAREEASAPKFEPPPAEEREEAKV